MGTNFYWKRGSAKADHMDPEYHIGKRSAAGTYCWDCKRTLCKGGEGKIHYGNGGPDEWLTACPICGKSDKPVKGWKGAAAVELGFAKPNDVLPKGVQTCSSFSWAQEPASVRARCVKSKAKFLIVDEYGRGMSGKEFLAMLDSNCPVTFIGSIGKWFS